MFGSSLEDLDIKNFDLTQIEYEKFSFTSQSDMEFFAKTLEYTDDYFEKVDIIHNWVREQRLGKPENRWIHEILVSDKKYIAELVENLGKHY